MSPPQQIADQLVVVEGVEAYWNYHLQLRDTDDKTKSLCGHTVFATQIPLTSWGIRSHLAEGWCTDCRKRAEDMIDE